MNDSNKSITRRYSFIVRASGGTWHTTPHNARSLVQHIKKEMIKLLRSGLITQEEFDKNVLVCKETVKGLNERLVEEYRSMSHTNTDYTNLIGNKTNEEELSYSNSPRTDASHKLKPRYNNYKRWCFERGQMYLSFDDWVKSLKKND